jgi:hypothetical protein
MKMNSIISWVGGKKALRDLIYQRMPKEFGRYAESEGLAAAQLCHAGRGVGTRHAPPAGAESSPEKRRAVPGP